MRTEIKKIEKNNETYNTVEVCVYVCVCVYMCVCVYIYKHGINGVCTLFALPLQYAYINISTYIHTLTHT
jgi:hypothetical protein